MYSKNINNNISGMNGLIVAAISIGIIGGSAIEAIAADNSLIYRANVIDVTGIIENTTSNLNENVTRGEFAQMLVNASVYSDYKDSHVNASVYKDVPASHTYADAIRIAAEQNWMTAYLGGEFKPDQPIRLSEAVRGILCLLGYTGTNNISVDTSNQNNQTLVSNSSVSADTLAGRTSLYNSIGLNEEIDRDQNEILNRTDCINLFYNLLKANTKSGQVYASTLGMEINSDGTINPLKLADSNVKGPKLLRKSSQLGDYVPFNVQAASMFLNGEPSSYEAVKNEKASGYIVIYYNSASKTIWAYTVDEEAESGRMAVRGTIENIYYSSADVMTPTAVTLDNGVEYKLESSEMQFAFSIYGSLRVNDNVTLICEKSQGTDGTETYSVIDYVEE